MGKVKVTISGFLKRILATRQVFFPYRTLVTTQCLAVNTSSCWSSRLAAVAFSMGQQEQGESLCKECATVQDWSGLLKLETDFAKVLQLFLRRKGRHMLAFEVMYFLRQFPKASRHQEPSLCGGARRHATGHQGERGARHGRPAAGRRWPRGLSFA